MANPNPPYIKGRWKKGQSGNPTGRNQYNREVAAAARQILESVEGRNEGLATLARIMREGERDRDKIQASELLLAYGYGRPTVCKEISGPGGGPVEFIRAEELSDDELASIAAGAFEQDKT